MTAAPAIQTDGIRPRFSGHESFPLRFGWLAKGVRFCRQRPTGFSADADAMVDLGVGKNMVRSIRFWALEAGMIEATHQPESQLCTACFTGTYPVTPPEVVVFCDSNDDVAAVLERLALDTTVAGFAEGLDTPIRSEQDDEIGQLTKAVERLRASMKAAMSRLGE